MAHVATDAGWTTWRRRWEELASTPVVVLFGGTSGEREVSLSSGRAVLAALGADTPPAQLQGVEITASGTWLVGDRELRAPEAVAELPDEALYFLGLHGSPGEDGRMQAFLELCGRRYTGSGCLASATCMDKRRAREAAQAVGVKTAPARLVSREAWAGEVDTLLALGEGPWFVKPNCGGSSVGVTRATDPAGLRAGLAAAFEIEPDALVELAQPGLEVTCGIVGNRGDEPVLLPVVEIVPASSAFFDYEEKYSESGARESCPPEHLSAAAVARVQERALRVYRAAGCEGYARIDFLVDGEAEPVFLESNTLPGFTPRSILPQAAAVTGVSFRELCLELCARALARFEGAR